MKGGGGTKLGLSTIKDNPSLYLGENLANKNPIYRRAAPWVAWGLWGGQTTIDHFDAGGLTPHHLADSFTKMSNRTKREVT